MTVIGKTFHKWENRFDKGAERFVFHHPYFAFLAMFVGLPIFILGAVTTCTMAAVLPLALIFGWL
ncbi:MAG: hypothetical protein Q4F29_03510 [Lachnospiraceae bacterium]|nr:hypothetical protein [Lachnospiraceae bacterium]